MSQGKVLIVDDSRLMHSVYESLFDDVTLLHAYDGREGLTLLALHRDTDLVLLDINMPRMDGLEFLREVSVDPLCRSVPVIIVSTEGTEADVIRGLQAGAAGYVRKPFESEALLAVIGRVSPALTP